MSAPAAASGGASSPGGRRGAPASNIGLRTAVLPPLHTAAHAVAADALATLGQRTADEVAAMDAGDMEALDTATRAKLAALARLRAMDVAVLAGLDAARVADAAALNREAARRVNLARARIEHRLGALTRAAGRMSAVAYGPDGRMTARG